jgi:hypothetical protein
MKITHAVDWDKVSNDLLMQLNAINYNPDLRLMLKNINGMVTELSKLEVSARRLNKDTYTKDQVEKINQAIDHLEKLILMAKLMS